MTLRQFKIPAPIIYEIMLYWVPGRVLFCFKCRNITKYSDRIHCDQCNKANPTQLLKNIKPIKEYKNKTKQCSKCSDTIFNKKQVCYDYNGYQNGKEVWDINCSDCHKLKLKQQEIQSQWSEKIVVCVQIWKVIISFDVFSGEPRIQFITKNVKLPAIPYCDLD